MDRWTVNEGTQVAYGDKMHTGGETFSATEEEITAEGLTPYVTKAAAHKAPQAEDKAMDGPKATGRK
jgi:hypothetical protein